MEKVKKGYFALITGASSGIGACFARKLAQYEYNLILIARRMDRLEELADEIKRDFEIEIQLLKADLSKLDELQKIENLIRDNSKIDLLINNAGFGIFGTFLNSDFSMQMEMINLHDIASIRLCRAVLPQMMQRKRGTIINVSSLAGYMPSPGSVIYCASKAFLTVFSEALQHEVRNSGIKIQALCPGFTITEFHDRPPLKGNFDRSEVPPLLWMSAEFVVNSSLKALKKSSVVHIPGWHYRIIKSLISNSLISPLIWKFYLTRKVKRIKQNI